MMSDDRFLLLIVVGIFALIVFVLGFFKVVERIEGILKGKIKRSSPINIRKKTSNLLVSLGALLSVWSMVYSFDHLFKGAEFFNSNLGLMIILVVGIGSIGALFFVCRFAWVLIVDIVDSFIRKKRPDLFQVEQGKKFSEYDAEREKDLLSKVRLYYRAAPAIGFGIASLISFFILWKRKMLIPSDSFLLTLGVGILLVSVMIIYSLRKRRK